MTKKEITNEHWYKPSTHLIFTYFLSYIPIYITYFLHNGLLRWNQILTQLRFIRNLSYNVHPVDGVLMGASSL
jgi:hypothetical protein